MKAIPSISVLMSIYSEPIEWVNEAISSTCRQTFADFEFLIVLDNPEYPSLKELEQIVEGDDRIVLLRNEHNIGLTRSLTMPSVSYVSWVIMAVKVALAWLAVMIPINLVFYRQNMTVFTRKIIRQNRI